MSSQQRGASVPLTRADSGRWLGGVCAGLAPLRGLGVGWMRVLFVLLALLGGLGIALYLACWSILPAPGAEHLDGEQDGSPGGAVVFAQACAACIGLALLALLATVATVFGFGWAIVALAAGVLGGVFVARRRLGPAWALLPIAALTLPAVAVATSGLRLTTQTGHSVIAPATSAQVSSTVYRSGLGTMLIDLRRTSFPAAGRVPLRIEAGVRRTIVALPAGQCVRVHVRYDVHPFAVRFAALLTGRTAPTFSDVDVFGRLYGAQSGGTVIEGGGGSYPVLLINFSSQGGSLYVRDYPTTVDPDVRPDWPGYAVHPEPFPFLGGEPRKVKKMMVRAWRRRVQIEKQSEQQIDALMPGPCEP